MRSTPKLEEEIQWASRGQKLMGERFSEHIHYFCRLFSTWCRVSASEIFLRHASCSALKPDAALDSTAAS